MSLAETYAALGVAPLPAVGRNWNALQPYQRARVLRVLSEHTSHAYSTWRHLTDEIQDKLTAVNVTASAD